MQWSSRRACWIGLVSLSVLVGTLAFLAHRYAADLGRTRAALERTDATGHALHALLGALADAETGQRGFLITHERDELEPYHAALAAMPRLLHQVQQSTMHDPALAAGAARLAQLANERMAELDRALGLEQGTGPTAAIDALRNEAARKLMGEIRRRVTEMADDLEAGNRAERRAAALAERATTAVAVVIVLVSIAVIALVGWTGLVELDAQRRVAAEMQRLKEAAEAADASRVRFVAFLSHELRSPLTSVIGFSEMLGAQMLGPLGHGRYAEYADRIRRGCEHLLELINDVLDLSKLDADSLTLREQVFATDDLLEHCAGLLVPQASRAGVALSWSTAPAAGAIYGDPLRLRQILTNLVANALKYTPAGGSVRVRAEREADGTLRLAVADTGIGIAEADLASVLEPFRQLDNAANRSAAGTGLGLPLTRRLVELHGGRLSIESELGSGTTAIVRLPAARVREAA